MNYADLIHQPPDVTECPYKMSEMQMQASLDTVSETSALKRKKYFNGSMLLEFFHI